MSLRGIILVFVSAMLTVIANLLIRGGVLRTGEFSLSFDVLLEELIELGKEPIFVLGIIFYGSAAIVWFSVLSIEELSTSYPILVGLTFVFVSLGAAVFFQEHFSIQKFIGMAAILGGIALVARA